jgi:hypothetical protein
MGLRQLRNGLADIGQDANQIILSNSGIASYYQVKRMA